MCVKTPHGDPLQRESKRKQRRTSSRVAYHREVIGEADDCQMEAPTSNPLRRTLRVGPQWAARGDPPQRRSYEVSSFPFDQGASCLPPGSAHPSTNPKSAYRRFRPMKALKPICFRLSRARKKNFWAAAGGPSRPGIPRPKTRRRGFKKSHTPLTVLRHTPARCRGRSSSGLNVEPYL